MYAGKIAFHTLQTLYKLFVPKRVFYNVDKKPSPVSLKGIFWVLYLLRLDPVVVDTKLAHFSPMYPFSNSDP